jgi:ubiquinone/menaquinone biosynthesis C-methylase UbiE
MADEQIEFGSNEWGDIMDMVYGNDFHRFIDLIERNDIFSVSGERGLNYLGDKLELTHSNHVLDLCSGMGGPARYLAAKYGCKVTGIDISESSYHAAQKRTKEVGLDHLVNFVHVNALDIPFPDQCFTYVIGSDAWLYFPDKIQLYKAAY